MAYPSIVSSQMIVTFLIALVITVEASRVRHGVPLGDDCRTQTEKLYHNPELAEVFLKVQEELEIKVSEKDAVAKLCKKDDDGIQRCNLDYSTLPSSSTFASTCQKLKGKLVKEEFAMDCAGPKVDNKIPHFIFDFANMQDCLGKSCNGEVESQEMDDYLNMLLYTIEKSSGFSCNMSPGSVAIHY